MAEEPTGDKDLGAGAPVWRDRAQLAARWTGRALFLTAGEILAVVVALAILGIYLSNTLLTRQSTDLGAFRPTVKRLVAQSFDGADASFGRLDLRWYPSRDSLVFTATDIEILDRGGETIQTLDALRAGLHVDGLRDRRPDLRNVEIIGGEVTWLERSDGTITAGLGSPQTVGRFGPVYNGIGETRPARGADWLEGFETLDIRDSRVHVVNESNGLALELSVDTLRGNRSGDAILLDLRGRALDVATGNDDGQLAITLRSPDALQTLAVEAELTELRLDRVAPPDGRFAVLRGLALPISAVGSGIYSRTDGLRAIKVAAETGSGAVDIAGEARGVRSVKVEASLDPGEQVMMIGQLDVQADKVTVQGAGVLRNLGRLSDGDVGTSPTFDLRFDRARADLTPLFVAPLVFSDVTARGQLDLDSRSLTLDALEARPGNYGLSLSAYAQTNSSGLSALRLSGQSDGAMSPQDLLSLWPEKFADGARRWIERSVLQGRIDRLDFDVDLDGDFFDAPALTPERLKLAFDVSGGEVRYIQTMTPLSGAMASGRIDGNALTLDLTGGRIGDVVVSQGRVDIPQLMPKGGDILIEAQAEAQTSSLLALVNQPPFQYLDRYGVEPDGFGGRGEMTLTVKRPLLEFFDPSRLEYAVSGTFKNASAPLEVGGFRLTEADVDFRGGKDGLFLKGPAKLGPWAAQVDWAERYGQNGEPTRYKVEGVMDQAVLDGFGLGLRQVMGGEIGVVIDATGQGVNVERSDIAIDLTQAEIALGETWSKSVGEPGLMQAVVLRGEDGFALNDVDIAAPGLDVMGSAWLGPDFALVMAQLNALKVDGLVSGEATLSQKTVDAKRRFALEISGDWLDVSDFVESGLRQTGDGLALPIDVGAEFDRVLFADDYALSDTVMSFVHDGEAIRKLIVSGERPDGPVTASIVENGTGRDASLRLPDMSAALAAVYGIEATAGGALALDATLPMPGEPGATIGRTVVADFKVVDAPFLAQMLSLASLTGLFDTLGGEGLSFDGLEFDFALREGSMSVRDARMSGPALGMTGEGDVDFAGRSLDFEGALVPAYTANSLLGDIPLLGDLLVGKDGEGVFALTYTVAGPFEKTQIAINPLSALTPGFLRGIFRSKRDDLPDGVDVELAEQIKAVRPSAED